MNKGRVKEFASPYQLLQNSNSQLYKMVEKTGPVAARKLHQMALNNKSEWTRNLNITLLGWLLPFVIYIIELWICIVIIVDQ